MKKFVVALLVVAMALSISVTAFAAAPGKEDKKTPSKTQEDMTVITPTVKEPEKATGKEFIKVPSTEKPVTAAEKAEAKQYKEVLEVCKEEVKVLSEAKSADKYFVVLKDKDEKDIKFKDIVKDVLDIKKMKDVKIHEFAPIVAGGFDEKCGDVELEMLFPTPYEKDEKVIVLFGIVTENKDGTNSVVWYAIEGLGIEKDDKKLEEKGCIKLEIGEELLQKIQNNKALIAVVSDDRVLESKSAK